MVFIKDLKCPDKNVTAEISKEEAMTFRQMCNIFYLNKLFNDKMQSIAIATNGTENMDEKSILTKTSVNLTDIFKMLNIFEAILAEMNDLELRAADRIRDENQIIGMLSLYFGKELTVIPFGSSVYGFGGASTDFNILIKTGENFFVILVFIEIVCNLA